MRKAVVPLTLILVFIAVAGANPVRISSANFFPYPGPDLPRIYIRNDGSIEPATAPIERNGNLYKLAGNIILYTIEIQCDNIVLDGSNHILQGNASWMGYDSGNNGIILNGRKDVTIKHLNIAQCYTGIKISKSSDILVVNNSIANGTSIGIALQDSTNVLVEGNELVDLLTDLNAPAVSLNGSSNTVKNNRITGSTYGIQVEGSSNVISDNRIEALLPLMLDRADSNTITRNNISGPPSSSHLPDQNYNGNEGISLFRNCSNNMISGNNLTGFINQAIRIVEGSNNTIYANNMGKDEFAIELDEGAADNTFYANNFAADSCKIRINNAAGNFWDNGTIGNYWGNYNGSDSNGDGIGDTPYTIVAYKWDTSAGGDVSYVYDQDNYPLIAPYKFGLDTVTLPASGLFVAVLVAALVAAIVILAGLLLIFTRRKRRRGAQQT